MNDLLLQLERVQTRQANLMYLRNNNVSLETCYPDLHNGRLSQEDYLLALEKNILAKMATWIKSWTNKEDMLLDDLKEDINAGVSRIRKEDLTRFRRFLTDTDLSTNLRRCHGFEPHDVMGATWAWIWRTYAVKTTKAIMEVQHELFTLAEEQIVLSAKTHSVDEVLKVISSDRYKAIFKKIGAMEISIKDSDFDAFGFWVAGVLPPAIEFAVGGGKWLDTDGEYRATHGVNKEDMEKLNKGGALRKSLLCVKVVSTNHDTFDEEKGNKDNAINTVMVLTADEIEKLSNAVVELVKLTGDMTRIVVPNTISNFLKAVDGGKVNDYEGGEYSKLLRAQAEMTLASGTMVNAQWVHLMEVFMGLMVKWMRYSIRSHR